MVKSDRRGLILTEPKRKHFCIKKVLRGAVTYPVRVILHPQLRSGSGPNLRRIFLRNWIVVILSAFHLRSEQPNLFGKGTPLNVLVKNFRCPRPVSPDPMVVGHRVCGSRRVCPAARPPPPPLPGLAVVVA